jgi:hypothetical protein
MKLFLISQSENHGWDSYDSAVVSAVDRKAARNTDPSGEKTTNWSSTWCSSPKKVKVEYLGETKRAPGVICASFNAG